MLQNCFLLPRGPGTCIDVLPVCADRGEWATSCLDDIPEEHLDLGPERELEHEPRGERSRWRGARRVLEQVLSSSCWRTAPFRRPEALEHGIMTPGGWPASDKNGSNFERSNHRQVDAWSILVG